MFRFKSQIYEKKTLKIGFLKINSGSGTTHFSLSSANYYCNKYKYRVLYADCRDDIESDSGIIGMRTDDTISICGMSGFRYNNIDFICDCKLSDITEIDENSYEVIIYRMSYTLDNIRAFSFFDEIFICGSAKPWHYHKLQECFKNIITSKSRTWGRYVFFGLTKKQRVRLKDEFGITAENMPTVLDPFYISRNEGDNLKNFLPAVYA